MSDTSNQFVVDLGKLKLTTEQRDQINVAIQKAAAGELARINITERIVLIPVSPTTRFPRWPIICGIIARPVENEASLQAII
jgi:hypothetical protein